MVDPIHKGGISTQINPFSTPSSTTQSGPAPAVGAQIQHVLFGRRKPKQLTEANVSARVKAALKRLRRYKKKLAALAGDEDDDYDVVLAEGPIAMIDEEGTIYVGLEFLSAFGEENEVLVGVLAHEIGHRPKRWNEYRTRRRLTTRELQAVCRYEETRADLFAGKALAEMKMSCEPVVQFLAMVQQQPHPEYFDARTRAEVIRGAHEGREYRTIQRQKLFPEMDRHRAPKDHIGEW